MFFLQYFFGATIMETNVDGQREMLVSASRAETQTIIEARKDI
jgi:hypothetical protein